MFGSEGREGGGGGGDFFVLNCCMKFSLCSHQVLNEFPIGSKVPPDVGRINIFTLT